MQREIPIECFPPCGRNTELPSVGQTAGGWRKGRSPLRNSHVAFSPGCGFLRGWISQRLGLSKG